MTDFHSSRVAAAAAAASLTLVLLSSTGVAAAVAFDGIANSPTSSLACPAASGVDVNLVGQGECVDAAGNNSWSFTCPASATSGCPAQMTEPLCAAACATDDGCTGYDLRMETVNATSRVGCYVFVARAPVYPNATAPWGWVASPGLQLTEGRNVVKASGAADACCYKNSWPRPSPPGNPVPPPPPMSDLQKAIFANISALAASASAAALPQLTALIDFCAENATVGGKPFPIFGAAECPGMADITKNGTLAPRPTTQQILERFALELRAAEYAHGFETLSPLMSFDSVFSFDYPWLFNLYQPCALGLNRSSQYCGWPKGWLNYDLIMQHFFGCKPFTTGNPPLNFHEASDRIVYTAMNWQQTPASNSLFYGTVNAVLRPKYTEPMMLFTPTDSYHYESTWPNCAHWPNCTAGTFDSHYHTLLAWMTGGGPPGAQYTPQLVAANCVAQMEYLTTMTCDLPPNPKPCALRHDYQLYWESDLLGNVQYPEGVKLIVLSFKDQFGTSEGVMLREWAIHYKWGLAWTLHDDSVCQDPRRLLDPYVLAQTTLNTTATPALATEFEALWTGINRTTFNVTYLAEWRNFTNATLNPGVGELLLHNIGAMQCADYDGCIGTTDSNGICVCYH